MSRWDRQTDEEFRMRFAEAVGDGVDPLDVVGRQWGGSRE